MPKRGSINDEVPRTSTKSAPFSSEGTKGSKGSTAGQQNRASTKSSSATPPQGDSKIDKKELALFEAIEKEAEEAEQDDDESLDLEDDEESKGNSIEEELRTKAFKAERAKALCPIRTRYIPEFERERASQGKKLLKGHEKIMERKEHHHDGPQRSQSSISMKSSSSSMSLGGSRRGTLDRMARRARRMGRRAARKAEANYQSAKEAATQFSATAWDDFAQGGKGADRILSEIVNRRYHADHEDLAAFGVVGAQLREVLQERSFNALKDKCDLHQGPSAYQAIQEHGRYFCEAQAESTKSLKELIMEEMLKEPRFQNLRKKGISREEAMKMMTTTQGVRDEAVSDAANYKSAVTLQSVEDVWWSNCKGQAAIRRKPEEHEAVYDFADNRISMPKFLADGHGGQLVTVKPELHNHGLTGEVTMFTRVPRRNTAKHIATALDQLKPEEVVTLELGADQLQQEQRGLKKHAHLSACSLPPSTKEWMDWRDAQLAKRRAAYEAALAAGVAAGQATRPVAADDDFNSQGSDIDPEALAAMSDAMSIEGNSARKTDTARSPGGSPRAPDPVMARGRRQGIDLAAMQNDNTRWDARMPPNPLEMRRLLDKCKDHSHHHSGAPMSWAAGDHGEHHHHHHHEHGIAAAQEGEIGYSEDSSDDPFADELKERVWYLKSVKGPDPQLDITFAVALGGGLDEEELQEPPQNEEDEIALEDFWKEIIKPVPKTWFEQFKDLVGIG